MRKLEIKFIRLTNVTQLFNRRPRILIQNCSAPKPILILHPSLDFELLILSDVAMNPDIAFTTVS